MLSQDIMFGQKKVGVILSLSHQAIDGLLSSRIAGGSQRLQMLKYGLLQI
jgi:hypothetical protein